MILFREVTRLEGDVVNDEIEEEHDPVALITETGLLMVVLV